MTQDVSHDRGLLLVLKSVYYIAFKICYFGDIYGVFQSRQCYQSGTFPIELRCIVGPLIVFFDLYERTKIVLRDHFRFVGTYNFKLSIFLLLIILIIYKKIKYINN